MIFVVIPAYNNQDTLPTMLAAVQVASTEWDESYRALVVDDGSSDETANMVLDFGSYGNFELLHHDQHQGEGAALKTGLKTVLNTAHAGDTVVAMSVGQEHRPALIKSMLALLRDESDVVIASRFAPGSREIGLGWVRSVLSRTANRLTLLLLSISNLSDAMSCCQAYRVESLQKLVDEYGDEFVQQSSHAGWLELLLKLTSLNSLRFAEAPLTLRHDLQPKEKVPGVGQIIRQHSHLVRRNWRYR